MPDMTLVRTETRDVCSRTGAVYRLFISRPDAPPGPGGFPVLYLLDGNATFPIAAVAAALQSRRTQATGVVPGLVVGIGYPVDDYLDSERRSFDYTPAIPAGDLAPRPDGSPWPKVGGAAHFLDFLEHDLQPMLARDFPVNVGRQAIFGHSFGGLFVLNALFTRPSAFRSYVAASPSIWFGNCAVLGARDAFIADTQRLREPRDLLVTVGSLEQPAAETDAAGGTEARKSDWVKRNRMVENARELVRSLSVMQNLRLSFKEFDDENHSSVLPAAISRAVRFALSAGPA